MSTSDELKEFVDAEIFLEGARDPVSERKLIDTLAEVEGIADTKIAEGRLDVRYDPVSISKLQICDRLKHAGFTVQTVEAAPTSPIVDAEIEELSRAAVSEK